MPDIDGLPYPAPGAIPDVPGSIRDLAEAVSERLHPIEMNGTNIPFRWANQSARLGSTLKNGQFGLQEDEAAFYVKVASGWRVYDTGWRTFTPTWAGIAVGNGTVVARYFRRGHTARVIVTLTFGSSTTVTGNAAVSSIPIPSVGLGFTQFGMTGTAAKGGNTIPLLLRRNNASSIGIYTPIVSGSNLPISITALSAANPFAWAIGDLLHIEAEYEIEAS